jgi:5-methylcytosine-specific restriction endonuclease McrA
MFLYPPTRDAVKYAKGELDRAPHQKNVKPSKIPNLIKLYSKLAKRSGRRCENCGKPYLAAPHLRLAIINPKEDWFSPANARFLCTRCNTARESDQRVLSKDVVTSVREAVIQRDARTCVYCLRGPLYGPNAELVSVVTSPNPTDKSDWRCACKTCRNDRGEDAHEEFIDRRYHETFRLLGYLRDLRDL